MMEIRYKSGQSAEKRLFEQSCGHSKRVKQTRASSSLLASSEHISFFDKLEWAKKNPEI